MLRKRLFETLHRAQSKLNCNIFRLNKVNENSYSIRVVITGNTNKQPVITKKILYKMYKTPQIRQGTFHQGIPCKLYVQVVLMPYPHCTTQCRDVHHNLLRAVGHKRCSTNAHRLAKQDASLAPVS